MVAMPVMVGSEVASRLRGMPRPPKLLCGLLADRTWAMMPQRGGRSPTAEGVLGDAGSLGWGVDVGQVSDGGWGWRLGPGPPGRTRTRPKAGASRVSWWTTRWKRSARRACIMRRIWSMVAFWGARASMLNRSAEESKPPVTHPGALDLSPSK